MNKNNAFKYLQYAILELYEGNDEKARQWVEWALNEMKT